MWRCTAAAILGQVLIVSTARKIIGVARFSRYLRACKTRRSSFVTEVGQEAKNMKVVIDKHMVAEDDLMTTKEKVSVRVFSD